MPVSRHFEFSFCAGARKSPGFWTKCIAIRKWIYLQEIEEFISKQGVPFELRSTIDAIRNIGNFAAHPLKDKNTGEICDVETGEADLSLHVLESLFDYVFIQPARMANKIAQLNAKLKSAGKPSVKL